jgi:AAA family ATP:ADP antiporter
MFEAGVAPTFMLHLAAGLILVHLALYWIVDLREEARSADAPASDAPRRRGGFRLVFRSRYLLLIAGLLVLLNIVNTGGEYIVSQAVTEAADAAAAADPQVDVKAFIGRFYGGYYFYVNLLAVLLQAFLASRIAKKWGTAGVVLALPLVALGTYGLIGIGVGFAALRWAKTAENATDYSIMNTGRQMLWLPTTTEEKYSAKQAIDTFFVRAGDLISAGLFLAGSQWLGLESMGFARMNVLLVGVWLAVAVVLLRENARISKGARA